MSLLGGALLWTAVPVALVLVGAAFGTYRLTQWTPPPESHEGRRRG